MTTIAEYAQSKGIEPGLLLTELKKKYPGQKLSTTSELPKEFAEAAQKLEQNIAEQSQQPSQPQKPVERMDSSAIVNADQAIQEASFKLVEADKATLAQAIAVQDGQSEVLGEASGIKGGLRFMQSHIRGKQMVLNSFAEEAMAEIHQQLAEIDNSLIGLANEASEVLGKSVRTGQQTEQIMLKLRQRVASMKGNLKQ
ncbi:hypothetical protein NIES2109_61950 (plasmid) [Nostoc sp. HK-01]|nr:hypothetical protein NIES2109_61950 [Nostoc sp. HK-01]